MTTFEEKNRKQTEDVEKFFRKKEFTEKVREQEKENIHSFMNQFTPLMEKLKDR